MAAAASVAWFLEACLTDLREAAPRTAAGGAETGVSSARLILRPHVPQIEAIQLHGLGLGGVLCGRFVLRTL